MNHFKNILAIAVLFAICSTDARVATTRKTTPAAKVAKFTPKTTPTRPRVAPAPIPATSKKSFQSLLLEIRNNRTTATVIDVNNPLVPLKPEFFIFVLENAMRSNLAPELTEALLQAGANFHIPLSGNDDKDIIIVQNIKTHIQEIMRRYQEQYIERQREEALEKTKEEEKEKKEEEAAQMRVATAQAYLTSELADKTRKDITGEFITTLSTMLQLEYKIPYSQVHDMIYGSFNAKFKFPENEKNEIQNMIKINAKLSTGA